MFRTEVAIGERQMAVPMGLAVLLIVSACSSGTNSPGNDPSAGADRAKISYSMIEDADTLDPTFGQTLGGRQVFANLCEKLYDINKNAEVVPQLAAALPTLSADGLTVTIALRKGVVFNDGTPFNAEAVKTTLDRDREAPRSARKGELALVQEVTAKDENTVVLTLKSPYVPLAAVLADRAGMILSPKALEKLGDKFGDDPVCVGPFSFVKRVVGDRIELKKSSFYYDADQVHIKSIIMHPIPDSSVRVANFRSGDLDIIDRIPAPDYKSLSGLKQVKTLSVPSLGHDSVELNTVSGPFKDVKVRQAFSLSIDREQINKTVYGGLYTASCQPLSKTSPYFYKDLTCPPRNVDAARTLLKDAGLQLPVEVTLLGTNDTLNTRRMELIQAQAKDAGFTVKVQPSEVGTLISSGAAGNFDAIILTWSGRVDPDANISVFQATDGSQNFAKASDPEIDRLLSEAKGAASVAKRTDLYRQVWDLAMVRSSEVVMVIPAILVGYQNSVSGLEIYPDGLIRLKGVR